MDLRERIVAAVDEGMSQSQAAERFGVSLRTVERYLARRRATGSLAATEQRHGREPKQRRQLQAWLPARLEAAADATLAEHAAAFLAAGGEPVSLSAMSRAIAGLPPAPGAERTPGGRRRRAGRGVEAKNLRATEREEAARAEGRGQRGGVDPARLVFVEERGPHTGMARRKARAARGIRARGAVPRNRGAVTTLLAGVSLTGMSPAMTVEGGTDTAVFATYLEHFLLPAPGMVVVVVDNVGAHQPDRIRQLVTAAVCRLVFLPAYSPDLTPIEEASSKIKALVKAAAARPRAALDQAIAAALNAVTAADAAGWFSHAGFPARQAA